MGEDGWVEKLAERVLAVELPRRWSHVRGVAGRATRLPLADPDELDCLVAAAWLHDVGYAAALVDTEFHPIDGARYLRRLGADERVVNLVAHHSCARVEAELRGLGAVLEGEFPQDETLPHDELCFCDLTTGPDGEAVDVDERLAEIRRRYAPGHVVRAFVGVAEAELIETVGRVETTYLAQPR